MDPIPANLDEADLLALIEGEPVANPRALRAAIEAHPAFGRMLVEMRGDRATLRAVDAGSTISAPASILEGLEARLEREALAGIARAEPTVTSLPISSVVVTRPGRFQPLLGSRSARRYAMAAGLVIVGGVSLLMVKGGLNSGWWTNQPDRPVAILDTDPMPRDDDARRPDPSPRALAAASGAAGVDAPFLTNMEHGTLAGSMVSRPEDAPTFNDLSPGAPSLASEPMTLARAAELARDGRLVIRVRADAGGAQAAVDGVRGLSQRSGKEVKWRVMETAPSIVSALAAKAPSTRSQPGAAADRERPIAGSEGNPVSPALPAGSPGVRTVSLSSEFRPLYSVELDGTEKNLESLLKNLDKGDALLVEFVELGEGVAPSPGLDPASMLWWGRKPGEWVKRVAVPIVLETRGR